MMLCTVLGLFVFGWLLSAEKPKPSEERNGDLHQIPVLFPGRARGGKLLQNYRLAVVLGTGVVLPR